LFPVRWAEAEFGAVKNIIKNYPMLFELFSNIAIDSQNFESDTRSEADNYYSLMSHVSFHILLSFLCDILDVINHYSKEWQIRAAVLIGQNERKTKLINELESLKTTNGPELSKLFNNLICMINGVEIQPCPEEYISGQKIDAPELTKIYLRKPLKDINQNYDNDNTNQDFIEVDFAINAKGNKLSETETYTNQRPTRRPLKSVKVISTVPFLSNQLKVDIITKIRKEIESYFPHDQTKKLDVLLPANLPIPSGGTLIIAYARKIRDLSDYFGYNSNFCEEQFLNLLRVISVDGRKIHAAKSELSVQQFWKFVLDNYEIEKEISNLIKHILVLPVNSAEAERGFTIFGTIRTQKTSKILPKNIDHKMRLQINL
jgi:hypothetical protein